MVVPGNLAAKTRLDLCPGDIAQQHGGGTQVFRRGASRVDGLVDLPDLVRLDPHRGSDVRGSDSVVLPIQAEIHIFGRQQEIEIIRGLLQRA